MNPFTSRIGPFILPAIATLAFLPLFFHKSESPVVLGSYSVQYTMLLILYAANVTLFWRRAALRIANWQWIKRSSGLSILSIVLLIASFAFLIEFCAGHSPMVSEWVIVALLLGIITQMEVLRRKSILTLAHVALVACSVVITLIVIELLFVFFLFESRIPVSQKELLKLMSSLGRPAIPLSKPPGTFRILGLSDSFGTTGDRTFNYHYLLETLLQRDVSARVQMVNVSVDAYQPRHELNMLHQAMTYSPDIVLHGFFVGNDFILYYDDMYSIYYYGGIAIYTNRAVNRLRPSQFLTRAWIENALRYLQEKWRWRREQVSGIVEEIGHLSREKFLGVQFERMGTWGRRSEKDIERMKRMFPILDSIRSVAERGGARYVMVIHPDETQVNEKLRREIIDTFHLDEDEYDFTLPQKMLNSYCVERGILCLDLLPAFRANAKDNVLFLLRDGHYNETGNRLAAASIGRFLRAEELLGKSLRGSQASY